MGFFEITAVVGLIVLANLVTQRSNQTVHKLFDLFLLLLNVPLFLVGLSFVFLPEAELAVLQGAGFPFTLENPLALGLLLQGMAVWGVLFSFRSTRHSIERLLPLNPHLPLHTLAIILSGYLVGLVMMPFTQDGLETFLQTAASVPVWMLLLQQTGFVLIALLGVGFVMRRDWTAVRRRLDLGSVNQRQLAEGLAWIAFLFVVQLLGQVVWELLDPETVAQVEEISTALYVDYDTIWEWLALAVGAGVGEEILFRGALQPVLGIWFTSIFFALIHVQYGVLTPATLVLFILAFSLGIIRRRHNTTLAIFVHFGYNLTLGLLSFYIGV